MRILRVAALFLSAFAGGARAQGRPQLGEYQVTIRQAVSITQHGTRAPESPVYRGEAPRTPIVLFGGTCRDSTRAPFQVTTIRPESYAFAEGDWTQRSVWTFEQRWPRRTSSACLRNWQPRRHRIVVNTTWSFQRLFRAPAPSDSEAILIQPLDSTTSFDLVVVRALYDSLRLVEPTPSGMIRTARNPTISILVSTSTSSLVAPDSIEGRCSSCVPSSRTAAFGVRISTLSAAMRAAGMPAVPGKPGWTYVTQPFAGTELREAALRHATRISAACPNPVLTTTPRSWYCDSFGATVTDSGITVTFNAFRKHPNGHRDPATVVRAHYVILVIGNEVLLREPASVSMHGDLNDPPTELLTTVAHPNATLIRSVDDAATILQRKFGLMCLAPMLSTQQSIAQISARGGDVFDARSEAPVWAGTKARCGS